MREFRTGDIARLLNVNPSTVKRWCQRKVIPEPHRVDEKNVRYWSSDQVTEILRWYTTKQGAR